MNRMFSRRTILRGAGVALALPWLESLAPRSALAQAAVRKRYMPIYIPNGTADFWTPQGQGQGAAWTLSGILEPLKALKAKMTVLTNVENGTAFNADGGSSVEPSHGRQPGAWLTCMDPEVVRNRLGVAEANQPSIDQLIAKFLKGQTPIDSLQVGLSTTASFCDSQPCSNSRTVSWNLKNEPMTKQVDPLEVFNKLSAVATPGGPDDGTNDLEAAKRIALNKSVLDAVKANTTATMAQLGSLDKQRLESFMDSVREVEIKATTASTNMGGLACQVVAKPTISDPNKPINNNNFARQNNSAYKKTEHADVMHDLIVMAFQCDATRVITYMMEDERSEFAYDHVTKRSFTATTSSAGSGSCGEYHNGGQHGDPQEFASIIHWNVGKMAELAAKLDGIMEENGKTVLDNTLIMFGSCMHGSDHACNRLPLVLLGDGGGTFKTDQHVQFQKRWLRDLHHTVMTDMYGMTGADVDGFGAVRDNAQRMSIAEILA